MQPSVFGGYRYAGVCYDILHCVACGMLFVNPLPDPGLLASVYEAPEYFDDYVVPGSNATGYLQGFDAPNPYDESTLVALARHRGSGRLLDIGCAAGRFLVRARERGYIVSGVEPNPQMAQHASEVLGLDVVNGTLEKLEMVFAATSFDVVHAGDVLEHVYDLDGTLGIVHRLLKDDGVFVLQQPMTYNRTLFNLFLHLNMRLKKDRYSPYPPLHLWEFTPGTLRRALTDAGFVLLELSTFEGASPPAADDASLRARFGRQVKRVSRALSNSAVGAAVGLGDRALVVCRKRARQ